jgi:hypothetical protein
MVGKLGGLEFETNQDVDRRRARTLNLLSGRSKRTRPGWDVTGNVNFSEPLHFSHRPLDHASFLGVTHFGHHFLGHHGAFIAPGVANVGDDIGNIAIIFNSKFPFIKCFVAFKYPILQKYIKNTNYCIYEIL